MSLGEHWNAQADAWIRYVRETRGDHANTLLNIPSFLELLPPPGRSTLDLGCGEGRLGALLVERGHNVVGVDLSPRLVEAARARHEALVADAASLPFDGGSFDLVIAFMSLHDMDDPHAAVREAARVLEPNGRLCLAVEHPLSVGGTFASRADDAPFTLAGDYFAVRKDEVTRETDGVEVTFAKQSGPLEWYARMLEESGFLIEAIREPVPGDDHVAAVPTMVRRRRVPTFLQLRALKR